jgi:hypothetical protein
MRTTFRVDDDIMRELKSQADKERLSLTRLVNRVLRLGLEAARSDRKKTIRFRERPVKMGRPKVDLTKALALAGQLESEEIAEKIRRGK